MVSWRCVERCGELALWRMVTRRVAGLAAFTTTCRVVDVSNDRALASLRVELEVYRTIEFRVVQYYS